MSRQRDDRTVTADAARKSAVTLALKRFVRRNAPRKRDRDAAIARAATMPLRPMGTEVGR